MGNCLMLLGLKKLKRPVTLLLVGLDNAGKTTAAKGIIGDSIENVAPTVGFCPETLEYRGCEVTIYDLGGGPRIRAVWTKYFSEIHGVIFVIDSSDRTRIEECCLVLEELLSHKKVCGKPVLVLANKQDVEGALDEIDLVENLKIEQIVNKYKCPTRMETCSALAIRKKKPDQPIADGFRWLIDTIVVHYKSLDKRVKKDMEEEERDLKVEMDKRKERLRLIREERERKEIEKEAEMDRLKQKSDSDEDIIVVHQQADGYNSGEENHIAILNVSSDEQLSASAKEMDEIADSTSESKELRELGFKSRNSLNSSTSSSSSSTSRITQRTVTSVHMSKEGTSSSPRLIQVHQSSSAASDSMEEYIKLDSYHEINLEDSLPRSSECVPIDSDDELFASPSKGDVEEDQEIVEVQLKSFSSPYSVANGSAVAGVRDQIELEASLTRKPKRKTFLRRLHKTAPVESSSVANGLITCEETTIQTPSGRIP